MQFKKNFLNCMKKHFIEPFNGSIHKNRKWPSWDRENICPKETKMGPITGHRIDYLEVGALRGQRHIPSKNLAK